MDKKQTQRGAIALVLWLLLVGLALPAWAAFATVGTFCTAQSKTAQDPYTFTTSAQLDQNNLGIIVVATDNLTGTDGNNNEHVGITDAASNSWTKAREFTNGQGAAAAGVTVSVWYSKAGANLASGGNVTVDFSGSITAKAVTCWEFTMDTTKVIQVDGGADLANDGADAGAITLSGLANIEHLWLRGTGVENNGTTYTASTNYTTFTHTSSTTSGNPVASNIGARGELRVFTGTSDSTDPTTAAADNASAMVVLSEAVPSLRRVFIVH